MSDTATMPQEEKQKNTVQILEVSARIVSILAGLAIGVFGHDWTAAAVAIAGGNAAASIGAKSTTLLKR